MIAVIMAGGMGTRIADLFPDIPKPLIPIGGVPVLQREIEELRSREEAESSAEIRERVNRARNIQHARFADDETMSNAHMGTRELREYCALSEEGEELLRQAFDAMGLSARSHDRILRVARTIADLDGAEEIDVAHIAEAIQYRTFDFAEQ